MITGRLKLIEQQLVGMDSAGFQNLCDIYLNARENGFHSFIRTGSQLGKQKVVKGTPDSFFRTKDERLYFVEYTTQTGKIVDKLKADISKSIDNKITGVDPNLIEGIILCINSRLTPEQETEVLSFARQNKIQLELIDLDRLSVEIYASYPLIAKDVLGVPLDTGQILPIQTFVEQYISKSSNLATPLDNIFMNRTEELKAGNKILNDGDLLILTGAAGVGKTKLALEAAKKFVTANPSYIGLVITGKGFDISEDLLVQIAPDKNYVLLVDDANRQSVSFSQVLGLFKSKRKGDIKVIATVRDYAVNDILKECIELKKNIINLKKFTDDEIKELISSDSFKIYHPRYQDKIIAVSNGNARLAVMAAKLALRDQSDFLRSGVYSLYDDYYLTFIKDFDLFQNLNLLKVLGLISFFFTIDLKNKVLVSKITHCYNLDENNFIESLYELQRRELVEIMGTTVRISEQIAATYFFYRVFINDKLLSFSDLLLNFFDDHKQQFREAVIPANNTFGYSEVFEKIKSNIDEYYYIIKNDEEKLANFLKLFWFYKRQETLTFIYTKVRNIEEPVAPIYDAIYETNAFVYETDNLLPFLTPFFKSFTDEFRIAIDLSFELARKKPETFPELIRRCREQISFDDEDEFMNGFAKQLLFVDVLIEGVNEEKIHYINAFLALSPDFLPHTNRVFKSGRDGLSFVHYNYKVPLDEVVTNIRTKVWNKLFELFNAYPGQVFSAISQVWPMYGESNSDMLKFDLDLLIPFMRNNLGRDNFEHIHFIHDFVDTVKRYNPKHNEYRSLKKEFHSEEYEEYKVFDWNFLRGKASYDFATPQDFERLKTKDIADYFTFNDKNQFQQLIRVLKNALSIKDQDYFITTPLNIIFETNFQKSRELGFALLQHYFENYPSESIPIPYRGFVSIVSSEKTYSERFWLWLQSWQNTNASHLKIAFLEALPEEWVEEKHLKELRTLAKNLKSGNFFGLHVLEKFEKFDENLYVEIAQIIVKKRELGELIYLDDRFFTKKIEKFFGNMQIVEKLYLQQLVSSQMFDYQRRGLQLILKKDSSFIYQYLELYYYKNGNRRASYDDKLGFVWSMFSGDEMEKIFDNLIENTIILGIGRDNTDMFFNVLSEDGRNIAKQFLLFYLEKNNNDLHKVNAVISIVRHHFNNNFEEFLHKFLDVNTDVKDFSSIWWRGNGGTYHGDVNIGEVEKADWQRIEALVDRIPSKLELIPIKEHIKNEIRWAEKDAEYYRLRRFTNPRY